MKIEGSINHVKTTLQQMQHLGLDTGCKCITSDKIIPRKAFKIKFKDGRESYIIINYN